MLKHAFRKVYANSPTSARLLMGRMWKVRGSVDRLLLPEGKVDAILDRTRLFFLLGSGRCGTMFLSRLLNQAPKALVLHEPLRHSDIEVRPACRRDPDAGLDYVRRFRKVQIAKKIREHDVSIYGECSQPLRCLGHAIRREIPDATCMILVRDGRAAVRSALNRQTKRGAVNQWNHAPVMPLPGDPYREKWDSMSDFEKACWWWMDSYRTLLDHLDGCPIIHFEGTLNDYDYLKSMVLDPLGIEITRAQWEAHKARKTDNAADAYVVKSISEWTEDEHAAFERIAGDTYRRLGYECRGADPVRHDRNRS